jgi:nucleotide-binding universal stress UspA family protein
VVITMKGEAYLLAICQSYISTSIPEGVNPEFARCEEERSQGLLDEGVRWLKERGVAAAGSLEYGSPVDRIAETAQRIGADLIVVGHKQRTRLARWWSESEEESLLERIGCSILVAVSDEE